MKSKSGRVYIVGAGPGDKGLITLKALDKIKEADVVVFDRLINDELLSFCKKKCEKIFVGKESGFHPIEQESITEILIKKSKAGNTVVRLKGGNPFVYGRGAEEAIALKKEGIQFEIIPGITSGIAAPLYSGIPVTHRGLITQCIFITAHECPTKPGNQVEWEKLAKLKNTALVIYMGASRIDSICNKLIENGMDPETPVAAIENGTLPKQRTLTAPLNVVAKEFKKQNFHAPVIIIVSQTVSFRDDISWYETKPLHNKKVVIAGNGEASTSLNNMLYELGADIQHLQVIKTRINFPDINLREIFSNTNFDWILFTSENGAKYFFGVLKENHLDSRIFGSMKIACVGLGTKNILETHGLTADYTSENFKPGSFKKEFLIKHNIRDKILLRVEDDYPYDKIYEELNRQGSTVQKLNLYNSISNQPDDELIKDLQKHHPDILIFTSPCSTVNFFSVLGLQAAADILKNCGAVLADPVIPEALLKKNLYNAKISTSLSDKNIRDIVNKLI